MAENEVIDGAGGGDEDAEFEAGFIEDNGGEGDGSGDGGDGGEGDGDGAGGDGSGDGGEGGAGGDGSGDGGEEGDATKALNAHIAQQQQHELATDTNAFWKHLDDHFDGNVDQVVNSDEFQNWLKGQPEEVIKAASNLKDPAGALKILDSYSAAQKEASAGAVLNLADFIEQSGLSEVKLGEGEDAQTVKEWIEEYPELSQLTMLMGQKLGEIQAAALLKKGGFVTEAQMREIIAGESKLRSLHSDADDVMGSDEFKTWVGKQPEAVKKMAGSQRAEDRKFVLNAYKEQAAAAGGSDKDKAKEKQQQQHQKKQDLHGASIEDGGGSGGGGDGGAGDDDFSGAWKEADEKEFD